ncbi:amidases [Moesziomyces antarcticus T-34]|uniref:amidase n=1 Tax=Pseudozyma antarctica (strain T-34) TaxID=1151754 RepID=M9M6L3_PSEA3|nr:amidases [Moesziomyces antarcticus T-34]
MGDYIAKSKAHRAKRDASIPASYLADLSAAGVAPLPDEKLPLPFSKSKPHMPEPTTIYPTDNVMGVPGKVLSLEDVAITETPIDKLLDLLRTGKLSSVRATEAFLRRAVLAHQLTNCCTDIFVDRALARAKECDDTLASTGKPIGLLHGLPVSLKDQFDIKDTEMTMGYVGWIGRVAKSNSVITDVILRAGGVPYVRTSIPQSLMRCETHNHIYGRTVSPFNRSFTPGGSSGGEGALVGMHGSPLGLGTDIGGSVRVPSAFNGLWGMRPSMHRTPYQGAANSFLGQESVSSVIGPLTHSLEGVVTFMRAVLAERPWELDPILVSMPFNEDAYALKDLQLKKGSSEPAESYAAGKTQLCFAIEWDDGIVHPHPPITRALRETKAKLEAAGHKVIDWVPYDHLRAYDIIGRIYSADGGEDIRRSCEQGGEPVMYNLMADGKEAKHLSTYESWQVNREKSAYRKEYLDYWQATKDKTGTGRPVDAIIAPVSNWASCPHDTNDHVSYTTQWNLLDRPCVVFPVGFVDPAKDPKTALDKPYTGLPDNADQEYWDRYDPERWAGMPINLQVVGKRLQDEELLGLAKVIRDAGATLH